MDERRKIVIPIGPDADANSEQTFFDTQARKDARPVVPLPGGSMPGPAAKGTGSRKRLFLVVALVAAIAAAGSAVAYAYFSLGKEKPGPQAAVQPVAGKTLSTLPWTHTIEDPNAADNANTDVNQTSDTSERAKKSNDTQARNDGDSRKSAKQKKIDKRGNKNTDDQTNDPVKRTQDELNKIREIFEGPP